MNIGPIFADLESLPYAWQQFPWGEEAIARFHGIQISHHSIKHDAITFYSKGLHGEYTVDCWKEQRGRLVLLLEIQDLSGILIDDQGCTYTDFEDNIGLVGRDLQEGLYNLMFGWEMERFKIPCEEPDEIFVLYQNGAFETQLPSSIKA